MRDQLRSAAPLISLWIVGAVVLVAARFQTATSLSSLVLDPGYVAGQPWYTGAISNLGILIWATGIALAGAGAWVAHRIGRMSAARFLAAGVLATLILLLDDVFRVHSGPLARLVGSKTLAQLIVVSPVMVWLGVFRRDILRTRSILLGAALGAMACSVAVDVLFDPGGDTGLLLEDGLKFLGILAWAQYFALTSRDIAASVITSGIEDARSTAAAYPADVSDDPADLRDAA